MDLYICRGDDSDLDFAQDASVSGQSVQQWQLRPMARESALREIANSNLRRSLSRDTSFVCADVEVGGSVIIHK